MLHNWSTYSDLTKVFVYVALATGIAAIFNIFMTQWFLVVLFVLVAVATGFMAIKKIKAEDAARKNLAQDDAENG